MILGTINWPFYEWITAVSAYYLVLGWIVAKNTATNQFSYYIITLTPIGTRTLKKQLYI